MARSRTLVTIAEAVAIVADVLVGLGAREQLALALHLGPCGGVVGRGDGGGEARRVGAGRERGQLSDRGDGPLERRRVDRSERVDEPGEAGAPTIEAGGAQVEQGVGLTLLGVGLAGVDAHRRPRGA